MEKDGKIYDKRREPVTMGRRGFLSLIGAGLGLAGLQTLFGGLPAVGRGAERIGSGSNGGGAADRNTSDVTARYWVRGDELAG